MTDPVEANEPAETRNAPSLTRRNPWPRVAACLVILVSGIVIGAGGTIILGRQAMLRTLFRPPHPGRIASHIREDLDLTPEQTKQFDEIFDRHFEEMRAIREEVAPRMRERFETMRTEVAGILNEDQVAEWESRIDKLEGFMERGPGGRGRHYADRWRSFDSNEDGIVAKEEVPEEMLSRFDRADENRDGEIDAAELEALGKRGHWRGGRDGDPGREEGDRKKRGSRDKP